MSEVDALNTEATEHSAVSQATLVLVSVALVLPVLSGILLFFVTSIPISIGISVVTVVATAALVAIDAHRLGKVDSKGNVRESAGVLFLGMCLFWIFVYPLAFFRRRSFGGPNLGVVAIGVALFFAGGPFVSSLLIPRRLPACSSAEVVQLLEQLIRSTSVGATTKSIDGHHELNFDRDTNVRHGECVAHTEIGDISVKYLVEWQDRDKGVFQVRLQQPDLPTCSSPEIVRVLEQLIRGMPVGAITKSIDGHRELSFDRDANVRHGECVAHTETGDISVKYMVEWQDRDKGLYKVRLPLPDLPTCSSAQVAQVLEQVVRRLPGGATTKSIDGHRELRFDRDANVRHGECVAHTETGDIPIHFIVEWQDQEKGLFHVRTVATTE